MRTAHADGGALTAPLQEQLLAFFDEAQQEMTKDDTKARLREAVRAGEVKPLSTCHRCCVPPQPEPKRWK
jgi:DNA invertase Pin-like site-specific DNA recombinase